jgi:hypothetical protein
MEAVFRTATGGKGQRKSVALGEKLAGMKRCRHNEPTADMTNVRGIHE